MQEMQDHFGISVLITKEICGDITPEEKDELNGWINQSSENKNLYNKLLHHQNITKYQKKYEFFDTDAAWRVVSREVFTANKKKLIVMKVLKYAALLVLPLLGAGIVYYFVNKPVAEITKQAVDEIIPGSPKARLILADGQTYHLDDEKAFNFLEEDGTLIEKRLSALDYSKDSVIPVEETYLYNTIEVPRGGEYTLILSDGTTVHLNSLSSLRYPVKFSGKYRMVELSGEAFFDVRHNTGTPFIVKINNAEVEVLGTEFNINAYEGASFNAITLEQGSIKIYTKQAGTSGTVLKPNQQALVSQNDEMKIREVNASFFSSWRHGKIIFKDERLEDIMDVLARWYTMDVFYLNPSVKELRFGGSLNKYESISPILEVFELTNKVKYRINGNAILFYE
jgi:transmembrane sensor